MNYAEVCAPRLNPTGKRAAFTARFMVQRTGRGNVCRAAKSDAIASNWTLAFPMERELELSRPVCRSRYVTFRTHYDRF